MDLSYLLIKNGNAVGELLNSSEYLSISIFFAVYVGPSMNPTLRENDIMEVLPYDSRLLRIGDVVLFLPPGSAHSVVHRIIRVTPAGIFTLGDNNTLEDPYLLQPNNIKGQVVAVWRGSKQRQKISGGLRGHLKSRLFRWRRALDRWASPLIHPFYQTLSRWNLIVWILPVLCRPRIVVFQRQERTQLQLLLGQRIIGRYDDQQHQWQIQRPFRLFVDVKALKQEKGD